MLLDIAGEDATEAFEDVGHSDESRKLLDGLLEGESTKTSAAFPQPSKSSIYQFQVDNLELSHDAEWPSHADGVYFSGNMDAGKDVPETNMKTLQDLNISISFLHLLLKKVRPHCERFYVSSFAEVFWEIDSL